MMIQRLRTTDYVDDYQPLPRHISLEPPYFKTHYRANRDPSVALIDPTNYHLLCIIEHFLGIPSYVISTRHNIESRQQINLNLLHDTIYGVSNKDQWDTCDMIQSLMIMHDLLCSIILIKYKYLYGNKKKQSRYNPVSGEQRLLIRTDNE